MKKNAPHCFERKRNFITSYRTGNVRKARNKIKRARDYSKASMLCYFTHYCPTPYLQHMLLQLDQTTHSIIVYQKGCKYGHLILWRKILEAFDQYLKKNNYKTLYPNPWNFNIDVTSCPVHSQIWQIVMKNTFNHKQLAAPFTQNYGAITSKSHVFRILHRPCLLHTSGGILWQYTNIQIILADEKGLWHNLL